MNLSALELFIILGAIYTARTASENFCIGASRFFNLAALFIFIVDLFCAA